MRVEIGENVKFQSQIQATNATLFICDLNLRNKKCLRMKNKKSKYALIVFFLFTIVYAYPQATAKMLEKAYKHQSVEELKNFFYAWSREVPPITDEELATYSDTIQEAYKAFIDLYKPHSVP